MKTKILNINGSWEQVVDDCRATVGKDQLGHEPSKDFKRKILIAEHSPIRNISVRWIWHNIKSWIATHWSRHRWECYIKTQRTDRTGVLRDDLPQGAAVNFTGVANPQNLIDTWRKRLCRMASPETREYAEDFKVSLRAEEQEISDVLVPNCVYRCGCPEMSGCAVWQSIKNEIERHGVDIYDIQSRYDAYNYWFYKRREAERS